VYEDVKILTVYQLNSSEKNRPRSIINRLIIGALYIKFLLSNATSDAEPECEI